MVATKVDTLDLVFRGEGYSATSEYGAWARDGGLGGFSLSSSGSTEMLLLLRLSGGMMVFSKPSKSPDSGFLPVVE